MTDQAPSIQTINTRYCVGILVRLESDDPGEINRLVEKYAGQYDLILVDVIGENPQRGIWTPLQGLIIGAINENQPET